MLTVQPSDKQAAASVRDFVNREFIPGLKTSIEEGIVKFVEWYKNTHQFTFDWARACRDISP